MVMLLLFRMMSPVFHCSKTFLVSLETHLQLKIAVFMRNPCAVECCIFCRFVVRTVHASFRRA